MKIVSQTGWITTRGSGVVVGHGDHVMTNAHVIGGAIGDIEVSLQAERGPWVVTHGQVVFSSEDIDLALIRVDKPVGEPIEVSRSLPALGDTLIVGGFPEIGGETLTATRGTVAGFEYEGAVIKFDGQIGQGSSGGAAINDEGKLVGIATWTSGEASGGSLGLLLAIPIVGHDLAKMLLEDSHARSGGTGSRYALDIVGIPAVAEVSDGWDMGVTFGYFDARAPGTVTGGLNDDHHVVGIFVPGVAPTGSPGDILDRIVAESEGAFEIVPNSQIKVPNGYSECVLLYNERQFEMSNLEARGSVIGTGWLSVAGLYTRFCVGQTETESIIGYVESPSREISNDDGRWLSSMIILSD